MNVREKKSVRQKILKFILEESQEMCACDAALLRQFIWNSMYVIFSFEFFCFDTSCGRYSSSKSTFFSVSLSFFHPTSSKQPLATIQSVIQCLYRSIIFPCLYQEVWERFSASIYIEEVSCELKIDEKLNETNNNRIQTVI